VARALQQVEAELRLPITPLDLTDEHLAGPDRDAPADSPDGGREDATRLRSIVNVAPTAPPVQPPGADEPTRMRGVTSVAPEQPVVRPSPVFVPPAPPTAEPVVPEQRGRGRLVAGLVSGAVVLVAVVAIGATALRAGDTPDRPTASSDFTQDTDRTPIADAVPAPHSLLGTRQADGSVVFTWENPDAQDGDQYLWGVLEATGRPELALLDTATVTIPAEAASAGEVCIEVAIVRADRRVSAQPAQGCSS